MFWHPYNEPIKYLLVFKPFALFTKQSCPKYFLLTRNIFLFNFKIAVAILFSILFVLLSLSYILKQSCHRKFLRKLRNIDSYVYIIKSVIAD